MTERSRGAGASLTTFVHFCAPFCDQANDTVQNQKRLHAYNYDVLGDAMRLDMMTDDRRVQLNTCNANFSVSTS